MSNLADYDFVLDLAKFDESVANLSDVIKGVAQRAPPLAPPAKVDLSTKTTSPKADMKTVRIEGFDEKFGDQQCCGLGTCSGRMKTWRSCAGRSRRSW